MKLKVTNGGETYLVHYNFEHTPYPYYIQSKNYDKLAFRMRTTCSFFIEKNGEERPHSNMIKGNGESYVAINSSKDNWVRKIGMVKSFSKALRGEVKDRSLRRLIFAEFWKMHGRKLYKNKLARVA